MPLEPHWQHVVPQREPHQINLKPGGLGGKNTCPRCKKPVKWVAADEGPESLKSMLRF